ncbi:MAG TPA: class I tRNA ligase family protein, partial [Actinophytocola sp.]|uniref:class I tRNA ligase family protein n=1 Tax=Actinophytocola sp. TaxID=1872138 RepID=UPI002DDD1CB5
MTDAAEAVPAHRYTAALAGEIERRWQRYWEEHGSFYAPNPVGPLAGPLPKDKLFVQDMFPYPSGAGLHVGHPLGFIGTDVFARFHRMCGRNVLHTMGFDAFGLPAEQYAVQTGQHPRKTTEDNIQTYLRQIRRLGLGHDERRRISTIDPEYYRWTQWIFLQIFNSWYDEKAGKARSIVELEAEFAQGKRSTPDGRGWCELTVAEQREIINSYRLAYLSDAPVNWVPGLGTVVSNEEVTADGRSERGDFPVFRKNLRQWMMRITAYADRLIDDLDRLDWPEKIKTMQRNWIGRSHGARIRFPAADTAIEVFTTRPDTVFGATYMVLAPEHPLVDTLTAEAWPSDVDSRWTGGAATPADAVAAYRRATSMKSDLDRQENRDKTGVFVGSYAVNPANDTRIPVFIADYVLMGYGTGAIMAVPAGDQRDFEFARAFDLPIRVVVQPKGEPDLDPATMTEAYPGPGILVNSGPMDGKRMPEQLPDVIAYLEETGRGRFEVNYRLRDWLISRQRYWGTPIPMLYCEKDGIVPVPDDQLPVELPKVAQFTGRGDSPLAQVPE